MPDGRGGYRRPSKPAPASGPGALSKRTDTQPSRPMPDAQYGEQQTFQDDQGGAPMAGNSLMPSMGGGAPRPPVDVVPFGAGTNRPDEPITAGIDMGAGPGSASLGMLDEQALQQRADTDKLVRYLPVLEFLANRPGASASLRGIVRNLKATL